MNRFASIEVNHLLVLTVIGQLKWSAGSVAIGCFGTIVWDGARWNRAVSILFLILVPLAA